MTRPILQPVKPTEQNSKSKKQSKTGSIGFRFRLEEDLKLLNEAVERAGGNRSDFLEKLVIKALHQKEAAEPEERDRDSLKQQIFELREELALVAEVLLHAAGRKTQQEAAEWADKNLEAKKPAPE
jgi:hypothetical protein